MKIVISSDDKINIRKGHFGRGHYFMIFVRDGDQVFSLEVKENPYYDQDDHQQVDRVLGVIRDSDVLIGKSMGRESAKKLKSLGKKLLLTQIDSAHEAATAYFNNELERFLTWDDDARKFVTLAQ